MKSLVLAAIAASCLAGCASQPVTTAQTTTVAQASGQLAGAVTAALPTATAAKVQSIAGKSCAFVPSLSTIAGIFASGNQALTTATSVASAICSAIAAAPAGNGLGILDNGGPPAVGNTLVHGKFKDGRKI